MENVYLVVSETIINYKLKISTKNIMIWKTFKL